MSKKKRSKGRNRKRARSSPGQIAVAHRQSDLAIRKYEESSSANQLENPPTVATRPKLRIWQRAFLLICVFVFVFTIAFTQVYIGPVFLFVSLIVGVIGVFGQVSPKTSIGRNIYGGFLKNNSVDKFFALFNLGVMDALYLLSILVAIIVTALMNTIVISYVPLSSLFLFIAMLAMMVAFGILSGRLDSGFLLLFPWRVAAYAFVASVVIYSVGFGAHQMVKAGKFESYFALAKERNDKMEYPVYNAFLAQANNTSEFVRLYEAYYKIMSALMRFQVTYEKYRENYDLWEFNDSGVNSPQKKEEVEFERAYLKYFCNFDYNSIKEVDARIDEALGLTHKRLGLPFPAFLQPKYLSSLVIEKGAKIYASIASVSKLVILKLYDYLIAQKRLIYVVVVLIASIFSSYRFSVWVEEYNRKSDPEFSAPYLRFFTVVAFISLAMAVEPLIPTFLG